MNLQFDQMIKRGWIEKRERLGAQISELLTYFGVQSLEGLDRTPVAAAFRVTPGAKVEPWRLAAWMRRGEITAGAVADEAPYDPAAFRALLLRLRAETGSERPWPALQERCADAGVIVVVVPALPKSGANGVTYWLNPQQPVIQLSLRNKRADIFWFTFFHEAAHVLEGHRKDAVIDLDAMPLGDELEQHADRFAADMLIPSQEWDAFCTAGQLDRTAIAEFANRAGVHSGIVVGRLQKEKLIAYSECNDLRFSYDDSQFPAMGL